MIKKERESTLTIHDCRFVLKRTNELHDKIFSYVCGGCQKTGFRDDMFTMASMIQLRDLLDDLIKKSKEKNG